MQIDYSNKIIKLDVVDFSKYRVNMAVTSQNPIEALTVLMLGEDTDFQLESLEGFSVIGSKLNKQILDEIQSTIDSIN